MDSNKIKHLEMIERIIERMASNCFKLKGWTITLVSAICALAANGSDKRFMLLALVPLISFWILDSFYLQQERKFKHLYDEVRQNQEKEIDFNMNTSEVCKDKENIKFFNCMFSITEQVFYILILVALIVLGVLLKTF